MKRIEWMDELERNLSALDKTERDKIIFFYSELYNDKADSGMTEAEILSEFGEPSAVAKTILNNNDVELTQNSISVAANMPASETPAASPNSQAIAAQPKKKRHIFRKIILPIFLGIVVVYLLIAGICTIVDTSTVQAKIFDGNGLYAILDLDIEAANVSVERGDEFRIEYEESAFNRVKISEQAERDSRKLVVKQTHNSLSWGVHNIKIRVITPDLSTLRIDISAGNLSAKDIDFEALKLDVSAGNVHVDNCKINKINVDISAGNAEFNNCTVDSTTVNMSAGNVYLSEVTTDGCYLDVSAGSVKLNRLNIEQLLKIDLSAGNIGGSIDGKETEFSVSVETSAGSSNLKSAFRDNANKRIEARISAGSLNLAFTDN